VAESVPIVAGPGKHPYGELTMVIGLLWECASFLLIKILSYRRRVANHPASGIRTRRRPRRDGTTLHLGTVRFDIVTLGGIAAEVKHMNSISRVNFI
jgi:hypothetical protein